MMSTPYMVLRFRFASNESLRYLNQSGYLFYDTMARKLYELPAPTCARERKECENHPIRALANATLLMDNITIQNTSDYTRNKTIMSLLKERHPGPPVKRYGDWNLLRVTYDGRRVINHAMRWDLKPNGYWDRGVGHVTTVYRYENNIRPRQISKVRRPHLFYEEGSCPDGFLVDYDFTQIVPDYTKKQTYDFRSLLLADGRFGPVGYGIVETCLTTDGRSKRGRLTRWCWLSYSGTNVKKYGPYPIELKAERPRTCIVEGVPHKSIPQLYTTLDRFIKAQNN